MVTIQIGRKLQTFKGEIILQPDGQPWTIKDVLLHYLGAFTSRDGKSVISAYRLGIAIADCSQETIEVENADFTLLREVTQNPQHGALVMTQLWDTLDEAEKTKTNPSDKKAKEV